MDIQGILVLIVILILLYVLLKYALSGPEVHTSIVAANNMITVESSKLGDSTNYAMVVWFYINDWNSRYGANKPLIVRAQQSGSCSPLPGLEGTGYPCPAIYFGQSSNNLNIVQTVVQGGDSLNCKNSTDQTDVNVSKTMVSNIPIQKWCCLAVSVYGRTMDIYLDGKLVKTFVMASTAKVDKMAPVMITPQLGTGSTTGTKYASYDGYSANFQYFAQPLNPQQVYDIYRKGFGGNWLSNLLNMQVKVTFSKNGKSVYETQF